jgi:hypothetical protein
MSVTLLDYTDEIGMQLETILQAQLPAYFAEMDSATRPPVPVAYYQGSVLLQLQPTSLPSITVSDEPPGGFNWSPIGLSVDSASQTPYGEEQYHFNVYYALEYRGTQQAHRVARKAGACIQAVLQKYALHNELNPPAVWKDGIAGKVVIASHADVQGGHTICLAVVPFDCVAYPTMRV